MSQPTIDPQPAGRRPDEGGRRAKRWILPVLGALAAVALIVGFVVWIGGGDEEITSSTPPSSVADTTTTVAPTTEPTSTVETTTTAPTTTTEPPATTVPVFALPQPGQVSWVVPVQSWPDVDALTMSIVSNDGQVSAYDGEAGGLRCVAIVGPGAAYSGSCGPAGEAYRFVADRGVTPWLVEVGATTGDVELAAQASTWALPTNGCSEPTAVVLGAVAPGPLPVRSLVCAGTEAFVGVGTLLFGDTVAPDGGGVLVGSGDEGWDVIGGFGTSIGCGGWPDGVDRCASFGVESELFEALLPLPPGDALAPSAGVIGVRDETPTVQGWIAGETDPAAIEGILRAQLDDPDAEVAATVRWAIGPGAGLDLLVVEVPQFDDSVQSESWAVWFRDGAVTKAFAWTACARGVTDGLCV
jgi:hypothetical protein